MGRDGGHHRDGHGVRRGTGADLSAAQFHPGAAGDDARPDRLVGGLIWPLVFVWGGVSFGIYTMSLIQLGERFTGQALIAGNAAFAVVWGIGGIVGSPATGLAMQLIGHQGLPSSLGLLCCVLAVFLMAERRRV